MEPVTKKISLSWIRLTPGCWRFGRRCFLILADLNGNLCTYRNWHLQFQKCFAFYDPILIRERLPYLIKYNVHTNIVCTWISQWFLAKKIILFFKSNYTRINHCKFIHHRSHLRPFLSYLPYIVCRKYFSIIFHDKSVHYTW